MSHELSFRNAFKPSLRGTVNVDGVAHKFTQPLPRITGADKASVLSAIAAVPKEDAAYQPKLTAKLGEMLGDDGKEFALQHRQTAFALAQALAEKFDVALTVGKGNRGGVDKALTSNGASK
jgi:hypothetical protein